MDPAPINPPHGGHETLETPMDGHLPVGATCLDQQPPSNLHHPVNPPQPSLIILSNGAPVFPTQQPKCGATSVGPGHPGQQPPFATIQNPGGFGFAGLQLPSIDERLLDCAKLINQLIEQQQHLQALFASYQSAMAAPPSSNPSQPVQHLEVRTLTRPDQAPLSPTKPCQAYLDVPSMVRSSTEIALGMQDEGGRTSQIQKGRKCNNYSAKTIRLSCEAGPLEAQDWLADSVGSGTPNVNGKQSGSRASPAAVSAQPFTGRTLRLPGEFTRDVIIRSAHPKIILASEGPAQRFGSDGVEDEDRCPIADYQASAAQWTTVSASNQQDQHKERPVSYAINAVDPQLGRWKQMSTVVPVDHTKRVTPVADVCILFVNIYGGCPTSHSRNLSEPRQEKTQAKCVTIAEDRSQPSNNQEGRWLEQIEVEVFVNLPPPWPPPVTCQYRRPTSRQSDARSQPEPNLQLNSRSIFSAVDYDLQRVYVDG